MTVDLYFIIKRTGDCGYIACVKRRPVFTSRLDGAGARRRGRVAASRHARTPGPTDFVKANHFRFLPYPFRCTRTEVGKNASRASPAGGRVTTAILVKLIDGVPPAPGPCKRVRSGVGEGLDKRGSLWLSFSKDDGVRRSILDRITVGGGARSSPPTGFDRLLRRRVRVVAGRAPRDGRPGPPAAAFRRFRPCTEPPATASALDDPVCPHVARWKMLTDRRVVEGNRISNRLE
ncbi:hypothetical protein EVAR_62968_1 [Eumeta japonica]|uniref:Uncharacterized protein n=1 Tax=Eumeta variegata TaxID=151549 RepID=A0A4C1ZC37_EUMVA|nr:hypothetical protein EVAR_62968_1 [Eumeta japonica]